LLRTIRTRIMRHLERHGLLQMPIRLATRLIRFAPDLGALQGAYDLLPAMAASVVTYHLIESPARGYLRTFAGVPKPA